MTTRDDVRHRNRVGVVGPEAASDVLRIVHGAFAGRPALDPPSTALEETEASVASALAAHGGLLGLVDDEPQAALLFEPSGDLLGLRRVGSLPGGRHTGISQDLVRAAEAEALARGYAGTRLVAREELPATVRFWLRQGYAETGRHGPQISMHKLLPLTLDVADAEVMRRLGSRIGSLVRAGDLVILTGDLGAGKTTLTQGIGAGLGVRGGVTSPTFVIARVHPSAVGGPSLVHVDAYRLGGALELDALDLDTDLDRAVTVVEWGEGLAETLADDRLEVALRRDASGDSEVRRATITAVGTRWLGAGLRAAVLS